MIAVAFAGLVLAPMLAASFVVLLAVPEPLRAADAGQGGTRHRGDHARDGEEKESLGELAQSSATLSSSPWSLSGKTTRRFGGVPEGETFGSTVPAAGSSTRSVRRFMARTGGLRTQVRERPSLRRNVHPGFARRIRADPFRNRLIQRR